MIYAFFLKEYLHNIAKIQCCNIVQILRLRSVMPTGAFVAPATSNCIKLTMIFVFFV